MDIENITDENLSQQEDNTENQTTESVREKASNFILSIDRQKTVETEADKARDALLDLTESMKTQRILIGTIQGVEKLNNDTYQSIAVIYHGDFKVIIPADQFLEPPTDFKGRTQDDVMYYALNKRLGAEIDYIIKGIDVESGVAVGSRIEAMAARRKQYYFTKDRNGDYLLYDGICSEARVVSVIRAGIFVDIFGKEIYIPLRELSYQRMFDANNNYQPGDKVIVKILNIDRSDKSNLKVVASVKQAIQNPYEKAFRRYSIGNRYIGIVSMVDTNGVFVSLDGGVDCLCAFPKRGRPPRGARVTVRILGINRQQNRIWGAITHVATLQ